MEFDSYNDGLQDNLAENDNLMDVLDKYLKHTKWFALSIFICSLLAFYYVYTEVPRYNISSTILIKDQEKGSSVNELAAFEDLGLFGSNDNSLENEIHLLTSRRLMKKVVNELRLNYSFFLKSSPYDIEQYPNSPLIVSFPDDTLSSTKEYEKKKNNVFTIFKVTIIDQLRFEYFDSEDESKGIFEFGKNFKSESGNMHISLPEGGTNVIYGESILVRIYPLNLTTDIYSEKLIVEPIDVKSRVIKLSIKESATAKGIALINNLIEQYNVDAVYDKNQIYNKTTEFLNDRIVLITSELNAIENTVEQFKTNKGLIDTKAGADIYLQSSSANENELITANTQLQLVNYMFNELDSSALGLLPANIGLEDASLIFLIGEYNTLILQRNRVLKSSTLKNPLIVNIDSELGVLKSNLVNSLNSARSSLMIQISALNDQSNKIGARIRSVPKNEKEYTDIVRQQETKNEVYLYLLQKREESILSNAITIDKARIVDAAYSNGVPISPTPVATYFVGILFGLLIPAGVIFIKDFLDTKVHDERDIRKLKIPYLGDVPLSPSKKNLYISEIDNSIVAEAFRYARTNINFMLDKNKKGKVVFVTSTQAHEGKTFTSINLASSLAVSGEKTLLLAMDLRAPKITQYLELEDILGVTNFVTNGLLNFDDIVEKNTKLENLHVINSGDIPPNPVELLMNKRINEIFREAKEKYDFIIVDTAPVGMVADTIQISDVADLSIYVIKADYLDKRMLHIPKQLYQENKLKNMAILINGTDQSKTNYGYGYGYGQQKKLPWHKRFFS